jgi:hypothetical protein
MAKSLLIKDEENLIHITLYYQLKKSKSGYLQFKILSEEEGKKLLEKKDETVDVLNTKWSIPTWKITNKVMRASTYYNPADGSQRLDPTKYRDNIFRTCLKEWDIQDDSGNVVPINEENIGQLPTSVAEELLRKYDNSTSSSEAEEKK